MNQNPHASMQTCIALKPVFKTIKSKHVSIVALKWKTIKFVWKTRFTTIWYKTFKKKKSRSKRHQNLILNTHDYVMKWSEMGEYFHNDIKRIKSQAVHLRETDRQVGNSHFPPEIWGGKGGDDDTDFSNWDLNHTHTHGHYSI